MFSYQTSVALCVAFSGLCLLLNTILTVALLWRLWQRRGSQPVVVDLHIAGDPLADVRTLVNREKPYCETRTVGPLDRAEICAGCGAAVPNT
jgi:hypothetical protein